MQHARQVVSDVEAVKQAMRRFAGIEDAELKIGGSNIPTSYMIPDILPLMIERFPGLRLTVIQGDSREILEQLGREEIELGIVGNRFDGERLYLHSCRWRRHLPDCQQPAPLEWQEDRPP